MALERVRHAFEPIYDKNSSVLLLGTMPSPKSREQGFYYGHPQNRFWPVLAAVFGLPEPVGVSAKRQFILDNGLALWDVLEYCQIDGADDASIRNPVCNDFGPLIKNSQIRSVFTTGKKATKLYQKYCYEKTGIAAEYLPSTSPANAKAKLEELIEAYSAVFEAVSR